MQKIYPRLTGFASKPFSINKIWKLKPNYTKTPTKLDFNILTPLQGGRMKIKFDRVESGKTNPNPAGRTYSITRVFGTALEGKSEGQEWSTQFFSSNKEMAEQANNLTKGETVNVQMKKNGNFWNPIGIEKDISPETPQKLSTSICGSGPTNKRFEYFKEAVKLVGNNWDDDNDTTADIIIKVGAAADMIDDYVEKKGAFQFEKSTSEGIPKVEEEDIPF